MENIKFVLESTRFSGHFYQLDIDVPQIDDEINVEIDSFMRPFVVKEIHRDFIMDNNKLQHIYRVILKDGKALWEKETDEDAKIENIAISEWMKQYKNDIDNIGARLPWTIYQRLDAHIDYKIYRIKKGWQTLDDLETFPQLIERGKKSGKIPIKNIGPKYSKIILDTYNDPP